MKITYRPEIDGLRFLAVSAVIIYHANISFNNNLILPGGFLGVDIFFVISGYLIGKLIIFEISSNNFSTFSFLMRRMRRILPALIFMSFFVTIFGFVFLFPMSFMDLCKSVISSLAFISNYYFLFSGHEYGAYNLLVKPMIHTWSLSVEFQFYVIIVLIFFTSIKLNISIAKLYYFIFFLAVFSFIFANIFFIVDKNFNFYGILTRLWELLIGFYLTKIEKYKFKFSIIYLKLLPIFGIIILTFSFFYFSYETHHPTYKTIPIILGTSIFILFIKYNNSLKIFFSNKIMVLPGLMSYSLYIWHYPILVFSTFLNLSQGSTINKFILFLFLILISFFSYYFIEKPFRTKSNFFYNNFILIIIIFISILVSFCLFYISSNKTLLDFNQLKSMSKLNNNFYWDNKHYLDEFNVEYKKYENNTFKDELNKKRVLIIGNSYGADFFLILKANNNLLVNYEFLHINSQFYCLEDLFFTSNKCNKIDITNQKKLITEADVIIISTRWNKEDFNKFEQIIQKLKNLQKKVIITSRYEFYVENQFTIADIFTLKKKRLPNTNEKNSLGKEYFKKRNFESKKINSFLNNYANKNNIPILKFINIQCEHSEKYCHPITDNNKKIYYDKGHLTLDGINFFSKKLNNNFLFNFNF